MQITNKFNLPQALVDACETEKHNKAGFVSATTLLGGTKSILLNDRHWDELIEDVSDRIWAIQGSAVHKMLQDLDKENFQEERFSVKVGSKIVTGQVDLYDMRTDTIYDYKNVNLWKIKLGDFEDFRKQGLIYAWLMKKNGLEVKKCRFVMMIKNWTPSEYARDPSLPPCAVSEYSFDVTDEGLAEIEKFIFDKVRQIEEYEGMKDDEIPPCSDKERWFRTSAFAVYVGQRKTATRVFSVSQNGEKAAKELAEKCASDLGGHVEERKSTNARCENYCSVCQFCSFYRDFVEKKQEAA